MTNTTIVRMLAEGLDHPEDVVWGRDGNLYASGEDGQIYRISVGGEALAQVEQIAHRYGSFHLGLTSMPDGHLLVCDMTLGSLLRFDPRTGDFSTWCEAASGSRLITPNYCAVRADGSVILTDSGSWDLPSGSLVLVPSGGGEGTRLDLEPLHYPNGCALLDPTDLDSPLVVVESSLPGLTIIDGSGRRVLVELPGRVPDGVAVASDGSLVVGCFQPNAILWVDPESGQVDVIDEDWTGQRILTPTNVAFYGSDGRDLAVASVCGWSIGTMRTAVSGVSLPGDPDKVRGRA